MTKEKKRENNDFRLAVLTSSPLALGWKALLFEASLTEKVNGSGH